MNNFKKAGTAIVLAGVSACISAGELPNTENMQGLQFNFSTPGARSLGMGGAFIGRADDATAAMANPAGLINLSVPELGLEYRHLKYKTKHTNGGNYPDIDSATASSSADNLSYFSFVKPGDKFTWALFRHQLMDYNTEFESPEIGLPNYNTTTFASSNFVDSDIATYGLSGAFRINDRVSLGASIQYFDFSMDGGSLRSLTAGGVIENQQLQSGSDKGWGVTLGGLFRLSDSLSMGVVYRNTPKFEVDHINETGDGSLTFLERGFDFEVPEVFGVGFSYQANDNLTFNLDINRISYSDVSDPTFWAFTENPTADMLAASGNTSIDDGTEVHLGVEYLFSNKPVALRAGVWRDPGHSLEYKGDTNDIWGEIHDAFFVGSKTETHFSLGIGFFQEKFSFDMAADFSDNGDTYSLSGVYYFN